MSIVGNLAGCYSPIGKTFIIEDADGNSMTGVITEQQTVFTATDNDVREGLIYASDSGISTGTKDIPAYHTTNGVYYVPANSELKIVITTKDRYNYTELQAMIIPWNTSYEDSVAVEKVIIDDKVYNVNSTTVISNVTKDSENKAISLGITNGSTPVIIRYFSYKEES